MQRLDSIQHLRGIAALLVVFVHFPTPLARFCGSIGVDLFFLISGFIIYTSIEKSMYYKRPFVFLKKRILRIVPLYWLVTALFILGHIFLNNLRKGKLRVDLSTESAIRSFFFIPIEKDGIYHDPVVFLGWSLNFEMLFYLITVMLLFLFGKRFFLPLVFLLICLGLIGYVVGGFTNIYLDFVFSSFLLYFGAGLLLGKYQERIAKAVSPFAEPLFFIAIYFLFVVMFAKDEGYSYVGLPREMVVYNGRLVPRPIIWGIPCFLFFISYFILAKKYDIQSKYLNILGDRSYSVYLLQIFFIYMLLEFTSFFTRHEKTLLSLLLIGTLVLVSGYSFKYFERKFHK